jgi:hypothetical protein
MSGPSGVEVNRTVDSLDDEAMRRIAAHTQRLMIARGGEKATAWMLKNADMVGLLAQCTWLAMRKELERE